MEIGIWKYNIKFVVSTWPSQRDNFCDSRINRILLFKIANFVVLQILNQVRANENNIKLRKKISIINL